MPKRILLTVAMLTFFHSIAISQNQFYTLTSLPLTDLSGFKDPGKNWKITGEISGNYESASPKAEKGTGTLFDDFNIKEQFNATANLLTKLEHGDLFLSLDFMMPKGSNSGVYLQGRYEIQLFDSWGVVVPHVTDCGSIYERWDEKRPEGQKGYEGHPARVNAARAPNLWQHLEIEFRAPRFDASGKKISSAQFTRVSLNGLVIHENVVLSGPTRSAAFSDEKVAGPLMLQGDHGPVAFRNIRYALLGDFHADLKDLTYEYYEGDFNDFPKVQPGQLVRKGKAEAIDVKLADNPNKQCLIFTGTINLKDSTTYQFIVKKIGKAKLSIDGEELIRTTDLFQDSEASKKLAAGDHKIVFSYLKDFSWAPTGMGLFIGKLNSRPQAMHTAASLPPLPPTPLIDVVPGREPERVRSFMEHGGKKKTHVMSVGDPAGVHYAYDLKQAALLQVWKGEFLNATDMWYERGEPQVATAMGATLLLPGRSPVALLASAGASLPDTLDDVKDLLYKGYTLNASRYPTFQYQYKGVTFTDAFTPTPDGKGLTRTITFTDKPPSGTLVLRLGEGTRIAAVTDGVYAIDDQRYYIRFSPGGKGKPEVTSTASGQALLWEITGPSTLNYTIYW